MPNHSKHRLLFTFLFTALLFSAPLQAGRCEAIEKKIAANMKEMEKEVAAFQKMAKEHAENVQRLLNAEKKNKK